MFAFSVFADPSERKLFVQQMGQAKKHMNLKLVVVFVCKIHAIKIFVVALSPFSMEV